MRSMKGRKRFGFRVTHCSVQGNHIHLIAEAENRLSLARGMKGLAVRIARGVNRAVGRRGPLFAERYHAHVLKTPREVRHAIDYLLANWFRHAGREVGPYDLDRFLRSPTCRWSSGRKHGFSGSGGSRSESVRRATALL